MHLLTDITSQKKKTLKIEIINILTGMFIKYCIFALIGFIWIIVLFCTEGVKEDNKWGSNPKLIN